MRCCTAARRGLGRRGRFRLRDGMAKRSTIPTYKRRRPRGSVIGRILGWIVKLVVAFFLISILWVAIYRFVPPPITITMVSDLIAGRGLHKDWMPISQIDRDMVRA